MLALNGFTGRTSVTTFVVHLWLPLFRSPEENPWWDEAETPDWSANLPISGDSIFLDINCILDLLSKMSSSPHHISGPVQCLPHLHAGLCRGDGEQFQLTAPSNLRKFIQALLASEVWQAIRHLCGELLQALVQRGVPHPACGRTFLQGAPAQPTKLNEYWDISCYKWLFHLLYG